MSLEDQKHALGVGGRTAYISGNCHCGGGLWYGFKNKDFKCDYCGKLFTEEDCPHQAR